MTRRGLQRWQSALTSRRSWKQSCIRLTRAGKSCDRLIEINLTNNSEESLVRRPRLGKNSADFSEQVAHATAKCKVRQVLYFLLQFWLCCRIYYLYTLPIRACSSSQVGGSFLLASIRKKNKADEEQVERDELTKIILLTWQNIQVAYARKDTVDKSKLKKYVKSVATEAKLYRSARMND